MYSFYVMSNKWSPIKIASVDDRKNISLEKTDNNLVNKLNKEIVTYLVDENNQNIGRTINFKIFQSGDIKSYYYKKLAWRRCTGFLFLQVSEKGIRHLCYFSDEIVHQAQCFGTSMENVSKEQVLDYIKEELTSDDNTMNVLKHVFNLSYNTDSLTEQLNNNFGI